MPPKQKATQTPVKVPLPTHVWEQQPEESDKAFAGFRTYRDLGARRSCTRAAKLLGKNASVLEKWSSEYQWVQRCRAFDMHEDRMLRRERHKAMQATAKQHVDIASKVQEKILKRLEKLHPDEMKVGDLLRALTITVKVKNDAYRSTPAILPDSFDQSLADEEAKVVRIVKKRPPTANDDDDEDELEGEDLDEVPAPSAEPEALADVDDGDDVELA